MPSQINVTTIIIFRWVKYTVKTPWQFANKNTYWKQTEVTTGQVECRYVVMNSNLT